VRDFEPKLALVGGNQGSEIIHRLINESRNRLEVGGCLIFEFSPMLAEEISQFSAPEWSTPTITKDLAGLERIVTLQLNG